MKETAAIAQALNETLARVMVQDCAIRALAALLNPEQGKAFAQGLRQHVASAMQAHAHHSSPSMDEAMTLQLCSILEAAGHAPKR